MFWRIEDEKNSLEIFWNLLIPQPFFQKDNKYEFRASSRKNIFKGFEILTGTEDEKVTLFPEGLEEGSELSLISNKYEKFIYTLIVL